jgi:hypothetical protein
MFFMKHKAIKWCENWAFSKYFPMWLKDVKLFKEIDYYNIPSIQRQGCSTRLQMALIEAQIR